MLGGQPLPGDGPNGAEGDGQDAGGGEAAEAAAEAEAEREELQSEDSSEIGQLGVEIEITPAGKSAKRLSLLSGGEKSMTALAFLFAVFLARPLPFYILDEVEAALDDLNLDRFLALLRRYCGQSPVHRDHASEAHDGGRGLAVWAVDGRRRGVEGAFAGGCRPNRTPRRLPLRPLSPAGARGRIGASAGRLW